MISKYLAEFDKPLELNDKIPVLKSDNNLNQEPVIAKKSDKSAAFISQWRAKVGEPWLGIKDSDLNKVCEFFYGGFSDPTNPFAKFFGDAQIQLKNGGLILHSIRNIQMIEDNRKTIEYPTPSYSTSLFVCKADIVYKTLEGEFTQPQESLLSWIYYLKGEETPFTFNFQSRKK